MSYQLAENDSQAKNGLRKRIQSSSIAGTDHTGGETPSSMTDNRNSVELGNIKTSSEPTSNSLKEPNNNNNEKSGCCDALNIFFEGDLAGFQIWWLLMTVTFFILKIAIKDSPITSIWRWELIFIVPLFNSILTGVFDYIIRRFHEPNAKESLKGTRFIFIFISKFLLGVYVYAYFLWSSNGFLVRFNIKSSDGLFSEEKACYIQVVLVFIALVISVFVSELMITTVVVNSGRNLLENVPRMFRFILFIIRPIVWVYNRTMVMFICFYAFYGCFYIFFVVGALCDYYCTNKTTENLQLIGLRLLTVPFTNPWYLFYFSPSYFNAFKNVKSEELIEEAVLMFLSTSFFFDILNSLYMFLKPICGGYLQKRRSQHLTTPEDLDTHIGSSEEHLNKNKKDMKIIHETPEMEENASNQL